MYLQKNFSEMLVRGRSLSKKALGLEIATGREFRGRGRDKMYDPRDNTYFNKRLFY